MKSPTVSAGFIVFAVSAGWAAPALADVAPRIPDLTAPDTWPVLIVAAVFVIVVSGGSFLLLRRMARKRVQAAEVAPPPPPLAPPAPPSEASEADREA